MGFAKAAPAKAAPAKAAAPVAKAAPAKKVAAKPAPVVEEVEAAPVARSRGPRGVSEEAAITLLHEGNPKRAGTKAFAAFAEYVDGMTVAAYCDAVGKEATPNLVYDAAHGFISIEGYEPTLVEKKERAARPAPVAKAAAKAAPAAKAAKGKPAKKADAEADMETQEESAD